MLETSTYNLIILLYGKICETYIAKYFKLLSGLYWGCRDCGDKREIWRTVHTYEWFNCLSFKNLAYKISVQEQRHKLYTLKWFGEIRNDSRPHHPWTSSPLCKNFLRQLSNPKDNDVISASCDSPVIYRFSPQFLY